MKKKLIFVLVFMLVSLTAFSYNSDSIEASDKPVTGWAWSSNIGWISMSTTTAPVYGVNINPADGNLTGYAWSSNIGWINFDPAGPFSQNPNYSARVNIGGEASCGERENICGWARACSVFQSGCSGALIDNAQRGDWDGWIFLGPMTDGVRLENDPDPAGGSVFRGFAWGGEPIGWISFDDVKTTYVLNSPPVASNPTSTLEYCTHGLTPQAAPGLVVTLNWTFFDFDGEGQEQYEIQVSTSTTFTATKIVTSTSQGYTFNPADWGYELNWNTTYHWRVRVYDGKLWSEWAESSFTVARTHPSPNVEFTFTPNPISVGEEVTFDSSQSVVYDGSTPTFEWTFTGGSPNPSTITTTSTTVTTTFATSEPIRVTLEVTDGSGYSCRQTEDYSVRVPLPDWKEIVPFGKIREMLVITRDRIFSFTGDLLAFF